MADTQVRPAAPEGAPVEHEWPCQHADGGAADCLPEYCPAAERAAPAGGSAGAPRSGEGLMAADAKAHEEAEAFLRRTCDPSMYYFTEETLEHRRHLVAMTRAVETAHRALAARAREGEARGASGDALALIAAERRRQVEAEGWTPEHDDTHDGGEMADAAASYAAPWHKARGTDIPALWPWSDDWWKPTPGDRIRELVKAGALIVAEIERLQRAALTGDTARAAAGGGSDA